MLELESGWGNHKLGCNPKHFYSDASPIFFNGAYAQESMVRTAVLVS